MEIFASFSPINVLAHSDVSLAAGTKVQIQNKGFLPLNIFSGDAAPAKKSDYFILKADEWGEFQGTVLYVWSDLEKHPLMVQEIV